MATTEVEGVEAQLARLVDERPNDPQVLLAVERLVDATGAAPGAVALLFRLYLHADLSNSAKGVATALIVKVLRRTAGLFDPRAMGLDPERQSFKMIHRGLRHHLDMAIEELGLLAAFQNGERCAVDAPKFIVAIPKSGSSMMGICLGNMVNVARGGSLADDAFTHRGYPSWCAVGAAHDWDLRPEIGCDPLFRRFPGGIYKGHITPSDKNFAILDLYAQSRYLVMIRDPRDQIVADYCDTIRARSRCGGAARVPDGEAEVRADVLRSMRGGRLLENLTFVGKWLARRHRERSLVVTYERLMLEPERVLREVADHFGLALTDTELAEIHRRAGGITDRGAAGDGSGNDRSIYPLGWTGRAGVWRTYFSSEAESAFAECFRAFATLGPWAEPIQELYPELAA